MKSEEMMNDLYKKTFEGWVLNKDALGHWTKKLQTVHKSSPILCQMIPQMIAYNAEDRPTATESLEMMNNLLEDKYKGYRGGIKNPHKDIMLDKVSDKLYLTGKSLSTKYGHSHSVKATHSNPSTNLLESQKNSDQQYNQNAEKDNSYNSEDYVYEDE